MADAKTTEQHRKKSYSCFCCYSVLFYKQESALHCTDIMRRKQEHLLIFTSENTVVNATNNVIDNFLYSADFPTLVCQRLLLAPIWNTLDLFEQNCNLSQDWF